MYSHFCFRSTGISHQKNYFTGNSTSNPIQLFRVSFSCTCRLEENKFIVFVNLMLIQLVISPVAYRDPNKTIDISDKKESPLLKDRLPKILKLKSQTTLRRLNIKSLTR